MTCLCLNQEKRFAEEFEGRVASKNCNLPLEAHFYHVESLRFTGNRILHKGEFLEQGGGC
jgi:hypothetical protein